MLIVTVSPQANKHTGGVQNITLKPGPHMSPRKLSGNTPSDEQEDREASISDPGFVEREPTSRVSDLPPLTPHSTRDVEFERSR